jgi:hypothetical protein
MEAFSDNTIKIGKYGFEAIKVSGSVASITGSLFGTSSQALTASYLLGGVSAQAFPYSGSAQITGSLGVTGSLNVSGSITTTGTITAQTLVVQTITSSIEYSSGSNIFGSRLTDTQTFTGSVNITGSLSVNGQTTLAGAVTAAGAIARGNNITSTLVAAANSDVLVALDINPTFTNGAFTTVSNYGLRTSSNIRGSNFNTVLSSNPNGPSYLVSIGNNVGPSVTGEGNILIGGQNNGNARTTAASITSAVDNVIIGSGAGSYITTGNSNIAIGSSTLSGNSTTQTGNIAIGGAALNVNTGNSNVAVGSSSGLNVTSGGSNVFLGNQAGRFQADGSTALALTGNNNIYIGTGVRGFNNSDTNTIVIGNTAIGLGSNTTVIGNSSTTATTIFGKLLLPSGLSLTGSAQITGSLGVTGSISATGSIGVAVFSSNADSLVITGSLNLTGNFTQVGYQILTAVSQSYNYANDAAAAAGGIPLGGLYRNGNAIQIRLA